MSKTTVEPLYLDMMLVKLKTNERKQILFAYCVFIFSYDEQKFEKYNIA